jgi:hypothetical protein
MKMFKRKTHTKPEPHRCDRPKLFAGAHDESDWLSVWQCGECQKRWTLFMPSVHYPYGLWIGNSLFEGNIRRNQ